MNSSVSAIPQAIKIARATGRISMQNVIFALAVKLLVLVLGFVGFANIGLPYSQTPVLQCFASSTPCGSC